MSAEDHAILVGISSYPEFGEGGSTLDLRGPVNDVEAVQAWLQDPKGGNLLPENIKVVLSSKFTAPTGASDAKPTIVELEEKFVELDRIAQKNKLDGKGQRVGRRLYIYMSGHGFSPARERGCLYTANAQERMGHNVHASGWLAWLQDAGYFREFVLWMDCCMNRMSFLPPRDPPMPPINVVAPPGPTFIAFAAQRPLKAVEALIPEDDEGKYHGVFTWALLEGLRGAAADTNGRVTGRSLADWIRNAQAARMDPRDLINPEVTKEPEVVREDPGLVFARGVPARPYAVSLSFAETASGKQAQIWAGAPPRIEHQFKVEAGLQEIALRPGLYLVNVPDAGLRQGFEVVGPTSVEITELGPPVVLPSDGTSMFELEVDPSDRGAEIFVIDHRFLLVDSNPGRLHSPLPFGVFKIKIRLGHGVKERVVLLDQGRPQFGPGEIEQPLATAAPLAGTAVTHEYQVEAAKQAAEKTRLLGQSGHRAALTVMARVWSPQGEFPNAEPWKGVTVVDAAGKEVLNLVRDGERHVTGDPFAMHTVDVPPGTYFLRQHLDTRVTETQQPVVLEQSLVIPENWALEVFLLRRAAPDSDRLLPRPRLSLLMRTLGSAIENGEEKYKLLEAARVALAYERRILTAELEELLMRKFQDPMAGILGAHLLVLEADRDPSRSLEMLDEVVPNLRMLVGPDHPDVEALSLRCPNPDLRRKKSVATPPMLQRSWKLLVEGSLVRPALVPRGLWRRVQAPGSLPPFFVWVVDEDIQNAFRRELARATWTPVTLDSPLRVSAEGPAIEHSIASETTTAGIPAIAPSSDFFTGSVSRAAPRSLPQTELPSRVSRKIARERALRMQVPVSALNILADEYQE